MNNKFKDTMEFVLKWEAGYSDHPNDPGGATNMGITLQTAQEVGLDKNGDGIINKEDVKNLTLEDALQVYKARYWNALRCDDYPFPYACSLMDAGVNHGVGRALKWHQIAQGNVQKFNELRTVFYIELNKQPRFKVFFRGWMNRINDLKKFITIKSTAA